VWIVSEDRDREQFARAVGCVVVVAVSCLVAGFLLVAGWVLMWKAIGG
jgi:hypothetical protein